MHKHFHSPCFDGIFLLSPFSDFFQFSPKHKYLRKIKSRWESRVETEGAKRDVTRPASSSRRHHIIRRERHVSEINQQINENSNSYHIVQLPIDKISILPFLFRFFLISSVFIVGEQVFGYTGGSTAAASAVEERCGECHILLIIDRLCCRHRACSVDIQFVYQTASTFSMQLQCLAFNTYRSAFFDLGILFR